LNSKNERIGFGQTAESQKVNSHDMRNLKRNQIDGPVKLAIPAVTIILASANAQTAAARTAVPTYHYDNYRAPDGIRMSPLSPPPMSRLNHSEFCIPLRSTIFFTLKSPAFIVAVKL
jgi:hypothetical protein